MTVASKRPSVEDIMARIRRAVARAAAGADAVKQPLRGAVSRGTTVRNAPRRRYTATESAALLAGALEGKRAPELAAELGRSPGAVREKLRALRRAADEEAAELIRRARVARIGRRRA